MIAPSNGAGLSPITPHSLQLQPILDGDRLKSCNRWRVSAEGATICLNTKTRKYHSHTPGSKEEDKPPPNHVLLPPAVKSPSCHTSTLRNAFDRAQVGSLRCASKALGGPLPYDQCSSRKIGHCVCLSPLTLAPHIFQRIFAFER